MAVVHTECLCPGDSRPQALAKISNNLSALFFLMSAGLFRGNTVNLGACLCSEPQILATINNNIAAFFTWLATNGLPLSTTAFQAGVADLALNDASKAVVFPTAFATAPAVIAVVVAPDNSGYVISLSPDSSTVSATGFTALFGAAIPASGYKLHWFASKPTP